MHHETDLNKGTQVFKTDEKSQRSNFLQCSKHI